MNMNKMKKKHYISMKVFPKKETNLFNKKNNIYSAKIKKNYPIIANYSTKPLIRHCIITTRYLRLITTDHSMNLVQIKGI